MSSSTAQRKHRARIEYLRGGGGGGGGGEVKGRMEEEEEERHEEREGRRHGMEKWKRKAE